MKSLLEDIAKYLFHFIRRAQIEARHSGVKIGSGAQIRTTRGLKLGSNVRLGSHSIIELPFKGRGSIQIDNQVRIGRRVQIGTYSGGSLHIGRGTSIHNNCIILNDVEIGQNCLFSNNIFVSSTAHHFRFQSELYIREQDSLVQRSSDLSLYSKPVKIHDDCWIGWGAVILPGVTIGKGAVIAANAVVKGDVEPYSVYGGVPAKKIGSRLEFRPPSQISAGNSKDKPYFYSGFWTCFDKNPNLHEGYQLLSRKECSEANFFLKEVGATKVGLEFKMTSFKISDPIEVAIYLGEVLVGKEFISQSPKQVVQMTFALPSEAGEECLKFRIISNQPEALCLIRASLGK